MRCTDYRPVSPSRVRGPAGEDDQNATQTTPDHPDQRRGRDVFTVDAFEELHDAWPNASSNFVVRA